MRKFFAICLLAFASIAHATTVGIDLVSHHFPERPFVNNDNPGVYVRLDSGWTAGMYYNTIKRVSVFAGYTFESGPFGLLIGGVTGYQHKRFYMSCPTGSKSAYCWYDYGGEHDYIIPLLSPSVTLGTYGGITPRVSFVPRVGPNGMNVVHLSIEHQF